MRNIRIDNSWKSPHKPVKSTWNGEILMTTKYVGGVKKMRCRIKEGWRGMDRRILFISANDNGVAPIRLPKYVEQFNKREGWPNPKNYTRN